MKDELTPYRARLAKWLPGATIATARMQGGADGRLTWRRAGKPVIYTLEHKANIATQDVHAVAQRLEHLARADKPDGCKLLLLAPLIRREQGLVLQEHGIDYLDLAGNAHLEAPGLYVHAEGLRPINRPKAARITRGWTKTVMALLIQPALVQKPYRPIAEAADVALGTVMMCFTDLTARGFAAGQGRKRTLLNLPDLLALWVQAYVETLRPRLKERRFQMKATDKHERWERFGRVFATHGIGWALTGADAAYLLEPHLRTAETEIYAKLDHVDDRDVLRALEMQPAVRGDVIVIEPPAPIVLPETTPQAGPPIAPDLLTYAELRYRADDQANEAADLLLPRVLGHVHP